MAELVEHDPARIRTLHLLTGGNPRTAVLLYGILAQGPAGDVRSDLEGLLDRVTPLYKARFEELSELGQRLVDALALHWDPASARRLADRLGWEVNLVSAQLARLQAQGLVEEGDESFLEQIWKDILLLFRETVAAGRATDALELLDAGEAGERWRPLREAVAAVVAGSADYLRQVAPEVSGPAKQIHAELTRADGA